MDTDDVLDAISYSINNEIDKCEEYDEIAPYLNIVIWVKDADDDSVPNWSIMTDDEVEEIEELNKIQGFKQEFDVIVFQNIVGFQDEVIEYYKLEKRFNSMKFARTMRIALDESYDSSDIDYKIDELRHKILALRETLNQKIC